MQDLDDLILFGNVARYGGFAAASRALGIPKSRLSRRVAKLEERLGVRLIQRDSRHFDVTDIGLKLRQRCEAIADQIDEADALLREAQEAPQGELRVTCPNPLATRWLAPNLPTFLAAHPNVCVRLEAVARRVDLIEERVDVAIRIRAGTDPEPDVVIRQLFSTRRIIVANPDIFKGPYRHPSDLSGLPAAHGSNMAPNRWALVGPGGETFDTPVRTILLTNEGHAVEAAALAGTALGLAFVGECDRAIAAGRLVQLLPEWTAEPESRMQVAFPTRRGMAPAVRAFIDFVASLPPQ